MLLSKESLDEHLLYDVFSNKILIFTEKEICRGWSVKRGYIIKLYEYIGKL